VIDDVEAGDGFRAMFADEANERIDSMVATLLELENGNAEEGAVDSLFRDAHTLKGGAGMLGLDGVGTLAHAVEDVLERIRGATGTSPVLSDLLLRATDALRLHVVDDDTDSDGLLTELRDAAAASYDAAVTIVAATTSASAAVGPKPIRVAPEKIDRLLDLVGESVLHKRRLDHLVTGQGTAEPRVVTDELAAGEHLLDELKDMAIGMRTLPLAAIAAPLPRAVRDIAQSVGKEVDFRIIGADTELDRTILEGLAEPLVHILRNAVGHGIESPEERERLGKPRRGQIDLHAHQRGGSVELVIADDGRGVSRQVIEEARGSSIVDILTRPGFSTAAEVTDLAGRGVGLDAVRRDVEALGGELEVRSELGQGTEIVLRLPLALALLDVLLVERRGGVYGIPLSHVREVHAIERELTLEGRASFEHRGKAVAIVDLTAAVGLHPGTAGERSIVAVVAHGGKRAGVLCDRLLGKEEIIVKPLGSLLGPLTPFLGGAILGDGRIALLLDPAHIVAAARAARNMPTELVAEHHSTREPPKVLVVEDSLTVRELQRSILEAAGYRVATAPNGREAYERVVADEEVELVLTDVEMPEMTGIELTTAIRASTTRSSLPIVIVTSVDDVEAQRHGLEAGADAYIIKRSFDQRTLLDTVERLVGR
jgi:two-component system chemotaxis sensor kinase CheA